jgi:predicted CXXCH cytochrome family protein
MEEPAPHAGVTFAAPDGNRWTFASDGRSVEERSLAGIKTSFAIAYQLGTAPLQQPVVVTARGRLQVLPFAWDARAALVGGQRWRQLAEDEAGSALAWTGPRFNWNDACAECHATHVIKGYDEASDVFHTRFSESDVSCEACHGPASKHVAWAMAGRGAAAGGVGFATPLRGASLPAWREVATRATRVLMASLPPPNEIEVCGRCHSRRRLIHADLPAGAPLLDTHVPELIEPPFYFPDGQLRDEVFEYGSFLQSKMSRAGVTCTNCHEPHSLALRAPGNRLCGGCHAPSVYDRREHHHHAKGSAGASCVACHMPERTYMLVDPRRDHSLRIPRPDLSVSLGTPNACATCHRDRSNGQLAEVVARWRGTGRPPDVHYGELFQRARSGDPRVATSIGRLVAGDAPVMVRATAASLLGAFGESADAASVAAALADRAPLVRLGALRAATAFPWPVRWPMVQPLLGDPVRAVRLEAARLAMDAPPSVVGAGGGGLARALDELLETTALNGDRADARELRARILQSRGHDDEALREYQEAMRLDPFYWPAYANAADLRRVRGEEGAALATLDEGLRRVPDSAPLHYARALALIRQGRPALALTALETAARLDPSDPRIAAALELARRAAH